MSTSTDKPTRPKNPPPANRRPAFAFTPEEWLALARSGDAFERRVEASKRGAGHASDFPGPPDSGACAGAAGRIGL